MSQFIRLAAFQPDLAPNLGALIRLAACFDVALDVIEPCGFAWSLRDIRKRALDYADLADITRHDSWLAYQAARPAGRLVLLTTKANQTSWDFTFQHGDTLLLGRESAGVPEAVHAASDARIKIPMPGPGRSLNIAIAAAVALTEAQRQFHFSSD